MKKFWIIAGLTIVLAGMGWGDEYTWTGLSGTDPTDWEDGDNWINNTIPEDPATTYPGETATDDDVIIPLAADYPTVPSTVTSLGTVTLNGGELTIPTGVTVTIDTVTINGGELTIDAGATVTIDNLIMTAGTLFLAGSESISSSALSGGTVVFTGTGTTLAGIGSFVDLRILGTITASSDVTATTLEIDGTLDGDGHDLTVTDLTINGSGTLTAGTGTITLNGGTWNNAGNFTHSGGTVVFDGADVHDNNDFFDVECTGTVRFTGSNEFNDLLCHPGSTVHFANGVSQTINTLVASGANLRAELLTAPHWILDGLTAASFTTNALTMISWCSSVNYLGRTTTTGTYQASYGATNTNIRVFAGDTFTWIGTADTDWNNDANWDLGYYPPPTDPDTKIIIEPALNQPELGSNVTCGTLTINTGAEVDLAGHSLTVEETDGLTNAGTIKLHGVTNQVTIDPPASSGVGGTIHYYNNASAMWVFGNSYTNLIVDSTATMNTVSGALTVSGDSEINADITTSGTQTYNTVTLGAAVTLEGTSVTINGIITGTGFDLTIDGDASLNGGGIGALEIKGSADFATAELSAVSVSVDGNSDINADITTTAGQTYTGAVTLTNNVTFKGSSGSTVHFGSTVKGSASPPFPALIIETANAQFDGDVGGTGNEIASVSVGGTTVINTANITTSGTQTYNAVTLGADVTLEGTSVTINGTIAGTGFDLTITGDGGLNGGDVGGLEISGDAAFETAELSAVSVEVSGNSTINADITTSGDQTYGGNVTLGGTRTLTSTGGGVSAAGIVSGTSGITVNASQGITMDNAGNTLSGNITLNNNQGSPTGDISFGTNTAITITGENLAASPAGNFTVNAADSIDVTKINAAGVISLTSSGGNITGSGVIAGTSLDAQANSGINLIGTNTPKAVSLTNTASGVISYNSNVGATNDLSITAVNNIASGGAITITETTGNITITGAITGYSLALNAENGMVTIGNTITLNSPEAEGSAAAVYIKATTLTGGGGITLNGAVGEACVYIDTTPAYTGTVTENRIHYHSRNGHIVYRRGADNQTEHSVPVGTYLYFNSNSVSGYTFNVDGTNNIYIIDVGNSASNSNTFTVNGSGFIEFRGEYTAASVTLNPGSGGVRLADSNAVPANPAAITLSGGAFNIAGNLVVAGANTSPASINAGGISIDGTINGTTAGNNKLSLDAGGSAISVTGNVGGGTPLGDLVVQSTNAATTPTWGVYFGGTVSAASYIQTGSGSTLFSSTQNYSGVFDFTGTALTVNGAMTVGGTTTITNSGLFTLTSGIASAGNFVQQGSSVPSNLAANITTSNTGASISFANPVILTGNAALQTQNGAITLSANITGAYALALTGGTGNITVSGQTGADTANRLGAVTVNSGGNVLFSQAVHAVSFTQTSTGSTSFNGIQNYSGGFAFAGTALTVNGAMTVGGTTDINNSGLFTLNAGLISDETVTITASSSGSARLAADITAGSAANISFTGPISLAKPDTDTVTLSAGNAISLESALTGPASDTNNLVLTASSITIEASGSINPNGTITINGDTTNNGTISAAAIANGNTAITFNGNYNGSAGSLNGAGGSNPYIDFYGNVNLGGFVHNDDIIRFAGTPGTNHEFEASGSTPLAGSPGDVVILGSHTVTVNTTVNQDSGKTLFLEPNSSLILTPNPVSASWIQGHSGPFPSPNFAAGFYGNNGTIIFDEASTLETEDFYAAGTNHTLTLKGKSTIAAWGNVDIKKTFDDNGGLSSIDYSTITMKGTNKELRIAPSVYLGNLVVDGGVAGNADGTIPATAGTILTTDSGDDLTFKGSITINNGKVLDGNGKTIKLFPRDAVPLGEPDNFWEQIGTGQFLYQDSAFEVGNKDDLAGGHTYALRGDTTWYSLICNENKATIQFSNYKDGAVQDAPGTRGHTVYADLELIPVDTSSESMAITITRETFVAGYPGTPAWIAPETVNEHFWFFIMDPSAKMNINYVIIEYSFSRYKIPVPTESTSGSTWYVSAWPYVAISNPSRSDWGYFQAEGGAETPIGDGHNMAFLEYPNNRFNVDWLVFNNFLYAYAEDSTHNGKIDRIRLQSAFDLNGDFSGFKVNIADNATGKSYTDAITGYEMVQKHETIITVGSYDLNSIYVLLDESKMPCDTAMTFYWEIAENTSLKDFVTGRTIIGNPAPQNPSDMPQDTGSTTDTAPPRITYALAVPGHSEIFFQVSEPVDDPNELSVDVPALGLSNIKPEALNSMEARRNTEFIVPLGGASFTPVQLSGGVSFTVHGLRDLAEPVEDLNTPSQERPYYFMYPPPKYPQDYNYEKDQHANYKSYIPVHSDPGTGIPMRPTTPELAWPAPTTDVVFPKNESYDLITGKPDSAEHRATDILISVPPNDLKDPSQHGRFFIWPLWAKYRDDPAQYDQLGDFLSSGYGYMGRDTAFTDSDIIWDFTGKRFLEQHDITLQSRISDAISPGGSNKLIYAFNIPDGLKSTTAHGSPGLWYPGPSPGINPPFVNLFPWFFPASFTGIINNVGAGLYNYELSQSEYPGNSMAEFFYHLDGTQDGLLAGRLDMAAGSSIPGDWYRRVRPFSFGLHDITRQRGGVTILNNVINSEKRERVFVDYKLNKTGRVTIQVFTLDGNLVKVLVREIQNASGTYYRVSWDGTNNGGRPVARGMYFIRIVAPDIDEIRKVMVIK